MLPLVEVQRQIRQAVVTGDTAGVAPLLVGGHDPRERLGIHRRHYETSLITALLRRFPATVWLTGSEFATESARVFVRQHPPRRPCIAEYGEGFPAFLGARPAAGRVPYLRAFAEFEWHVGDVSVAVARRPLPLDALSQADFASPTDFGLTVQPGVRYLEAAWPVDTLLTFYLADSAPAELAFAPEAVWLEIRGARGDFHFKRLDAADFRFRRTLAEGRSVADAADAALDTNAAFAPGLALTTLMAEGLATGIRGIARTGA